MLDNLDTLLADLSEFNLEGTVDIKFKYRTDARQEDIDRDLRMAKIFRFPHPKKPRLIEIKGRSNLDNEFFVFTLSNHMVLEWRAERYPAPASKGGISIKLYKEPDGDFIELMEKEWGDITYQCYQMMIEEVANSPHWVPPIARTLLLMGGIMVDHMEEILNKQGYTCQKKII